MIDNVDFFTKRDEPIEMEPLQTSIAYCRSPSKRAIISQLRNLRTMGDCRLFSTLRRMR